MPICWRSARYRILLDCGLFDSDRIDPDSPNRQFTFDPRDARRGDRLARPQRPHRPPPLPDPGRLQRADLHDPRHGRHRQRHAPRQCADPARGSRNAQPATTQAEPPEPLFELVDVEWVVERLKRLPYAEPREIVPGVTLTYLDAGHILGSAIVQLDYRRGRPAPPVRLHRRPGPPQHGPPARPDGRPEHRHPGLREHLRQSRARSLRPADQAVARDRRPGDPAPEQDRHPGLQPGPDPADGLLPSRALRGPQGPADPDLRRQPAGHAPDRDPPRSSRCLHAAGPRR